MFGRKKDKPPKWEVEAGSCQMLDEGAERLLVHIITQDFQKNPDLWVCRTSDLQRKGIIYITDWKNPDKIRIQVKTDFTIKPFRYIYLRAENKKILMDEAAKWIKKPILSDPILTVVMRELYGLGTEEVEGEKKKKTKKPKND